MSSRPVAIQIEEHNLAENIVVSEKLAKEVRLLKAYAVVATIVCAALFTLLFAGNNRPRQNEIIRQQHSARTSE